MAKATIQPQQVDNVKEKEVDKKPEKITKAYLNKIKDREIPVRSMAGRVNFKSPKTNIVYKWIDNGDEEIMTVAEIMSMESKSKRFLHTPWLVIDDVEVIEGLGLNKLYEIMGKIDNIEELLDMTVFEIEGFVKEVPFEYKEVMASNISKKIQDNELRDIVLIKELERILNKSFV